MTLQTAGNGKSSKTFISLVVGQEADLLERTTKEGFTHRWKVFVRTPGPHQPTDRRFIKKVVFNLHPEFKNPERIIRKPPFEVNESGYGSFPIGITVFFADEVVKPFTFSYELYLYKEEPTYSCRPQILQITDPKVSKSFMEMIPKYCSGSISPGPKEIHAKESSSRNIAKDNERPKKREKREKEASSSFTTPNAGAASFGNRVSSKGDKNPVSDEQELSSKKERKVADYTSAESSPLSSSIAQLFSESKTKAYKSPDVSSSPARSKKQIEEKRKLKKPKSSTSKESASSGDHVPREKIEKKSTRIAENDLFSTALQNAALQKAAGGERKRKIDADQRKSDVDQLFSEKKPRHSGASNGAARSSSSQRLSVPSSNSRPSSQLAEKKIPIPSLHKTKYPGKKTPEDPKKEGNAATSRKPNTPLSPEGPLSPGSISSTNTSDGSLSNTPSTASTGSQSSPGAFQNGFEISSPYIHDEERIIDIESLSVHISGMSDPTSVMKVADFLISSDAAHLVSFENDCLECDLRRVQQENPSLLTMLHRICSEQSR